MISFGMSEEQELVQEAMREFAADAFAVRSLKTASPLTSALTKLATQNLTNPDPAPWVEFLLHSHPSIRRRVRHAQQVDHQE